VEAILRCIIADNHGYLREENAAAAAVVMTAGARDAAQARHNLKEAR
jgi:hypothetical protein